jgi:hypothetical protein
MAGNEPVARSWWSTLPGVITALAGLVTAIGGFLVVLAQLGIWSGKPAPSAAGSAGPNVAPPPAAIGPATAPAPAPAPVTATATVPPPLEGRPYKAVVVTNEDRATVTLGPSAQIAGKTLPLENGLSIDLDKIASIEMRPPWDGSVRVTLIDGQVLEARALGATISGSNELGDYVSLLRKLRRIEFVR